MNESDFAKIDSMIARHVGTFAESVQHKLDLVVEGHQMLSERIDRVDARLDKRMDCLEHKLDSVAAKLGRVETRLDKRMDCLEYKLDSVAEKLDRVAGDLSAHRRDTEAHPPVYKVKEGS
jgi:uncharacterized coiled-coil protein SlyX